MAKKSIRLSLIAAACTLLIPATQVSAMSLLQAYDAALQNDPVYRSAISENIAGQEYKVMGRSGLLPSAQYSYSTGKNKAEIFTPNPYYNPDGTAAIQKDKENVTRPDYTSISYGLSVRQTLFNLDATARYRQGIAQTNYSDAVFNSRAQDLIVRLLSAYADTKYAEDQLNLYTAQRNAYAEQKRINDRMFEKGEGTRTDMLETQAKLDVSEAMLIEAADNLTNARNALAAIVGKEITNLDGFSGEFKQTLLSPSRFEEWKSIATESNPELAAGRYALEASEQEINKARAGHAPRLDLNASFSRSVSDSISTYTQDSTVRSIGVQLVIPIYSGGYVNAASNQAVANRDKARADLDATTNKVMIELRKQFNAVQTVITKMSALEKSVNSASLLVEATKQSVKGGVRINVDVLNAEQQLVAAKRDLAQARYNYLISFLKLRAAAGTLNIGDLRTVAGYFSPAN
ncbi:TolC family outer membrane protein [Undibacterium sp. SXout7W]|uniref:TolC family outer membrane protein n=1 Tax=Undibacterium sp. SXout7W TaxID=3413049 RepID=UPI003BF135C1